MEEKKMPPIGEPGGPPGGPGGGMANMMENLKTMSIDGEWEYTILSPTAPPHTLRFYTEDGVLKGTHQTEHELQEMQELKRDGRDISWKAFEGSHGGELFLNSCRLFPGGIMLGTSVRQDEGGPFPESPICCKSKEESMKMEAPPDHG